MTVDFFFAMWNLQLYQYAFLTLFIKSYCLPCTLNGSFAYAYIYLISSIGHLEDIGSLDYTKLPNGTILYNITFVGNTT